MPFAFNGSDNTATIKGFFIGILNLFIFNLLVVISFTWVYSLETLNKYWNIKMDIKKEFGHSLILAYIAINNIELAKQLKGAFTTKGNRKGKIKKTAPKGAELDNVAWNAIMSNICLNRVQTCNVMFYNTENKELFLKLSKDLDRYIGALNSCAQCSFEFNMYAHNHDTALIRAEMRKQVMKFIQNNS